MAAGSESNALLSGSWDKTLINQIYDWIISKISSILNKVMLKQRNALEKHIESVTITPDDPAILMWFDQTGMLNFVNEANRPGAPRNAALNTDL